MTATRFLDRVMVGTETPGTGTVMLGDPLRGYRSFAEAGAHDGDVVRYLLEHRSADWEIGEGTYRAGSLTRSVIASSLHGAGIPIVKYAVISCIIDAATLTEFSSPTIQGFSYAQIVPASVWTIVHNLNRYPSVVVLDSAGEMVEGDIAYPTQNAMVLSFAGAFAGTAYMI